jgi:hypothetical protein
MQLKVVNTITGEIMEFTPKNMEDVIAALVDIKGLQDALERAQKKLKAFGDELLGDTNSFIHEGLKYALARRVRNPQEYDPRKLRRALDDEDLFMDFVKISKTDFDNWRREHIEELSPELAGAIAETLEYTGKGSTALVLIKSD